ncbi:hypothetical protein GGF32_001590 [Allomyces javanicus]|nr:hypothetical protein GGF32_001590 [Allomyces javanicus]
MLQKVALVGAGTLLGGGAVALYFRNQQQQARPASAVLSVPQSTAPSGAAVPLPHTLVTPAGRTFLSPRHAELLKYGLPNATQLQLKQNYVSLIDFRLREPLWVLEHLTKANVRGDADRANVGFTQDNDVPKPYRASNDDYAKSGYSRGHMAPASNNKTSIDAMRESFLLSSNIVPQDLDNNMFYWNRMERWVRQLVTKKGFDAVHIMSGPLFLPSRLSADGPVIDAANSTDSALVPHSSTSGSASYQGTAILAPPPADVFTPPPSAPSSRQSTMIAGKPFGFVSYKTIGDSHVAVPTHLFKAILAEKSNGDGKPPTTFFAAFIVPNTPVADHLPLKAFQVPRETLEKYAGFQVYDRAFQMLPVMDLCAVQDPAAKNSREGATMCQLENATEFKLFTMERDLGKARSRDQLEKMYGQIQALAAKEGMPVPEAAKATYEAKSRQL